MDCTNSQSRMFPTSPWKGRKSPGKATPEAPTHQQTWNILSADGRERPGGKRSLRRFHPAGKPPGTPGDQDVPAGITPAATRIPGLGQGKGKVWKTSHQGKCLENLTFPPKFPSTAAASGSDMEGKDRKKERENPEPPPRAPGTAWAGSSLEWPLPPGEMEPG